MFLTQYGPMPFWITITICIAIPSYIIDRRQYRKLDDRLTDKRMDNALTKYIEGVKKRENKSRD